MGKGVEIRAVSQRCSAQVYIGEVLMDKIHKGDKNIITEKGSGDYKIRVCARCHAGEENKSNGLLSNFTS